MAKNKKKTDDDFDPKDMLDYLLKYVDAHMVQVEIVDQSTFIAYCKDEDRGDLMFKIETILVDRDKSNPNDEKETVNDGTKSEKEV